MKPPANQDLGLFVIRGDWDDLPALLTRHAVPFQELGSVLAVCERDDVLANCRALYIGCGADVTLNECAIRNIRAFVARGGGLYASDLAAAAIETLFPGMVTFTRVTYQSDNPVRVVDPGMTDLLGETLSLHMDYENAQGIQSVAEGVRVHIQGKRGESDEAEHPYLVTFSYGQGEVLYTVFHNAQQMNQHEEELLRYLIFRPMMVGALNAARRSFEDCQAVPLKEVIAAAEAGQVSVPYRLERGKAGRILLALHWQETPGLTTSFGVQLNDPVGSRARYYSSDRSPLVIDLPARQPGTWTCRVKAICAVKRVIPYILLLS